MKVTHGLQNLNGEAVAHFEFELRTQQRREGEGRGGGGRGVEGGSNEGAIGQSFTVTYSRTRFAINQSKFAAEKTRK